MLFVCMIGVCFLKCSENIFYDNLLWQHDDFKDEVVTIFKFLTLKAEGKRVRGKRWEAKGQEPRAEVREKPKQVVACNKAILES